MSIFTEAQGRNLYRLCKLFNCTPDRISGMDSFVIEWALANINKDDEEEALKMKHIFDAIKPWLDFELYKQTVENEKKKVTQANKNAYQEELMKHGAQFEEVISDEEKDRLKKIEDDMNRMVEE